MDIEFTGRGVEITPALKNLATEKLQRIARHSLPIARIKVTFTVEKHSRHAAEINAHLAGIDINAESEDDDMYKALDMTIDKFDRQVIKHKEKLKDHR